MNLKSAIRFLESPYLRFTPNFCLNDPFENSPSLTTNEHINSLVGDEGSFFDRSRRRYQITGNHMNDYGVICLSETHDNLLMWSHYCDEHNGVVIEFDIDEENIYDIFQQPYREEFDSFLFKKVDYRKSRNIPPNFITGLKGDIGKYYFFIKSDEWIYEKEHRIALSLFSADKIYDTKKSSELPIDVDSDVNLDVSLAIKQQLIGSLWYSQAENGLVFLKEISKESVAAIYIGHRANRTEVLSAINDGNYEQLIDAEKGGYQNIYQASPHHSEFKLEFVGV